MTVHHLALLGGLFLAPLAALLVGHRLARRPARTRALFWGLVAGHTIAALLATAAALHLPTRWDGTDVVRGLLGFWAMLALGALGALAGWVVGGRPRSGR